MQLSWTRLTARERGEGDYWLAVLVVLFLVLNAGGLFVYARAHPHQGFWNQVWSYLESDTAKLVAASLIFPLLLLLVERRFNVLEAIRAARLAERKRAQEERRESRLQT